VIRHGYRVLFSEPACWEAIGTRYEDICKILREKYGQRVRDLVPTPASEMWLYGDKVVGSAIRVSISEHVFGNLRKE
jgi:hypothetical protein